MSTPIGPLLLKSTEAGLTNVYFQSGPRPVQPLPRWRRDAQPFVEVERQLTEYFAGRRRVFTLRLAPTGTDFQLLVWRALQNISFGQTTSYGQIARDLGQRNAARAVGLANGSNPLPIIIPCHRVIGANGSLTGFGGGLDIKRALLRLEGAECVSDLFSARDGEPALDDTQAQVCPRP
ncbi:MAG: methylated-DNA--[protein]-cysteine S-methyltransferase [Proteobacteria bacterium]|nr:methylated-DNA--[protein]-cysteine S-methyltransferase [Pseudomonadota bacterium]